MPIVLTGVKLHHRSASNNCLLQRRTEIMGEVSSGDAEKEEEQEACHQQDGSSRNEGAVTTDTKVILGIEYRGELHNGKREGYGVQKWPNGCRYEGYFHNDTRHGQGKHWWPNGEVRRTLASLYAELAGWLHSIMVAAVY